mgnify:CR=1 FL=1
MFLRECRKLPVQTRQICDCLWYAVCPRRKWYRRRFGIDALDSQCFSKLDRALKLCAERRLPMVNGNPNFICIGPDGSHKPVLEKIVERYESFGGKCNYFGKPHEAHFEACIKKLGLPKDRVAHVGDSMYHDIVDANKSVS